MPVPVPVDRKLVGPLSDRCAPGCPDVFHGFRDGRDGRDGVLLEVFLLLVKYGMVSL